jgi:integrase
VVSRPRPGAEPFQTFEQAKAFADTLRQRAGNLTIAQAVTDYLASRNVRPTTAATDRHRLVAFLRLDETDRSLRSLSPDYARQLFARRAAEVKPDTLAGELAMASRWARWCVEHHHLNANPFEGLEVTGERSAGKPQLRVMEARRFLLVALNEPGNEGLACAMALLMGMRASEITNLTVRDVDDGGRLVWITRAKTKRGVRRLTVPALLVPRLALLAHRRAPTERLWGDVDRHWLSYHVQRIADLAKVPRVTPHGLRGTWATLAVGVIDTNAAAAALGHRPDVTLSNYAEPGADQSRRALNVASELATPGVPVLALDTVGTEADNQLPVGQIPSAEADSGSSTVGNTLCDRGDSNPHGVTH